MAKKKRTNANRVKATNTIDAAEEQFFSAPPPAPLAHAHAHAPATAHATEARDPRIAALMGVHARSRRARFAKLVQVVVGGALVLCAVAGVRAAIRHRESPTMTAVANAATNRVEAPPAVIATETQTVEPAPVPAAPPASEPPVAVEPSRAPPPAPSAAEVADAQAAMKEKRRSQQLLEQGRVRDAIEHAVASTSLDPADAEAWLILGAAYQMIGDQKEARRAFGSCLSQGKRGPRGECAAMPH